MKVLDVNSFQDGISATIKSIDNHNDEIKKLAESLHSFLSLGDSFKGNGPDAIRAFYQECHIPFLLFYERTLVEYRRTLKSMSDAIRSVEPEKKGFIRESFLEQELIEGLNKMQDTTIGLTDEVNKVLSHIQDITSINPLNDDKVIDGIQSTKKRVEKITEELNEMDQEQLKELESVEQNIAALKKYAHEMKGMFSSNKMSVSDFNIQQLQEMKSYNKLQDMISEKDWTALEVLDTGILFDATAPISSAGSTFGTITDSLAISETAYAVIRKGSKISKIDSNGYYNVTAGRGIGFKKDTGKYHKNYIESQSKLGNELDISKHLKVSSAVKDAFKSKVGLVGVAIGTGENVMENINNNETKSKIVGDAAVDTAFGVATLAGGAAVSAIALGTFGAPILGAAAIGIGATIFATYLLDGVKFGKDEETVSDKVKDGVEKGIKTIAGWF
ncbi:LXG domain-containing protein [Metabacillus sp. cB07]|uniref:LXG domain-containing protein n=1 Tax=Metabacillus sp. cB07 TaxID=2806989 RepID=UPI001939B009|nr:LXG domain-containing protein [Metabacillus sp. cB07]